MDLLKRYGSSREASPLPGNIAPENDSGKSPEQKYIDDQAAKGVSKEQAMGDFKRQAGGLKEPDVANPLEMFFPIGTAAFVAKSGARLFPSLLRAVSSAAIGTATEYPLGQATGKVEEKFPKLSLPFSVVAGMVSGMTIENMAEKGLDGFIRKGIRGYFQKKKTPVSAQLVEEEAARIQPLIEAGKADDEISAGIIEDLNAVVAKQKPPAPQEAPLVSTRTVSEESGKDLLVKVEGWLQQDASDLLIAGKAININFARIESGDDVKDAIAKTAKVFESEIQESRRHVQSNRQTELLASLIGITPEKLIARRKGAAFNAEEALASRRILISSGQRLAELAHVVSGRMPISDTVFKDMTVQDLQAAFQQQLLVHTAIQEQVSGMTAEAGRALQSFRIQAKSTEGKLKQMDELMRSLNRQKVSTEDLAAMVASIDTAEGLNVAVRGLRKATSWDMVMEAWINGLLSGPVTHAANLTSNGLVAVMQIPERALAAGISKITGSDAVKIGEAQAQGYGMIAGFVDGLKAASKSMWTGEETDILGKVDIPMRRAISAKNIGLEDVPVAGRAVDLLGAGVRIPGRALMAEDAFFKSVGYRMELQARAYRNAVNEGLEGRALTKRIAEIVQDPPDDIRLGAVDAARYQTFTKELGETGRAGLKFLSHAPALRLIVPFVQTPVNILKYAGERTPLAFASKAIREDLAAGGPRREMALARMSMGSMVMGTAATLSAAGYITGGGPSDPELRQNLQRQGWQPYSLKIGATYYGYNRLEPLGMMLGIAADAAEIIGQVPEEEAQEIASAAVIAISKNVTSKTWLKGVSDAVETLKDPDRKAKRFLQGYARSLIPTGVAQVTRVMDPTLRSTYSDQGFFFEMANAMKARIPGWSEELPPKRNLWGDSIVMEGAFGPDIASPIFISTARKSPIDSEMGRLKVEVVMPKKIQSFEGESIDLTAKEYDRMMVLMNHTELPQTGMNLKDSLDRLVQKDPEYKAASDARREVMIRSFVAQAKEMGKAALLEESKDLRFLVDRQHIYRQMNME